MTGSALIGREYNGSVLQFVRAMRPDHEWLIWRFPAVPAGFWQSEKNKQEYLDWVAKQLNVQTMEDWYQVTKKQLDKLYGAYLHRAGPVGGKKHLLNVVWFFEDRCEIYNHL
jgi:hypothetical protein